MDKITIVLNREEWDRIIEILDFSRHPDSQYLLNKINTQLHYSPADELPKYIINNIKIKESDLIKPYPNLPEFKPAITKVNT